MEVTNNKEGKPLEYYLARYQAGDPAEMAARCGLPWDGSVFTIRFLGRQYTISHPDLTITGETPVSNPERILFLRYLLDGQAAAAAGKFLAYQDFPWGEIMEKMPAQRIPRSDQGWQVELMPGLEIQFLLWLGDEEFPPNAQILFSDNFQYAFTAEDLANIGDIVMNRMKMAGTAR